MSKDTKYEKYIGSRRVNTAVTVNTKIPLEDAVWLRDWAVVMGVPKSEAVRMLVKQAREYHVNHHSHEGEKT